MRRTDETSKLSGWQAVALVAVIALAPLAAQAQIALQAAQSLAIAVQQSSAQQRAAAVQQPVRRIVISIPDRKLALIEDGQIVRVYPVAVGAMISESPTGEFKIVNRITNPTYYHPGKVIGPGPENPIGTRWIGLSQPHYGIHGTNEPRSIGKAASHGCIRMAQRDLEELFRIVRVGDTVEIRSARDSEVAQIFAKTNEVPVVMAGLGK